MKDGWVHALAPAKVNLTLAVLGKRADGYHDIHTWMLATDLCDRVRVRRRDDGAIHLSVDGPFASSDVPADERNLAWRAARGLIDAARARGLAGSGAGLDVCLTKFIPSQAGLGGGSSDAAAVFLAARAALAPALPEAALPAALAPLGSDCVFFAKAHAGLASCEGRGELCTPHAGPVPRWWLALAIPELGCATSQVYARVLPAGWGGPTVRPSLAEAASHARGSLRNDLEKAAIAAFPALAAWKSLLRDAGLAHWLLAGSGSGWFGLHDDEADARAALERVATLARARGLGVRMACVARPAGHGARVLDET